MKFRIRTALNTNGFSVDSQLTSVADFVSEVRRQDGWSDENSFVPYHAILGIEVQPPPVYERRGVVTA